MALNYLVAQLGARMHYAVPRILYQAGMLERFYTDISAATGLLRISQIMPRMMQPTPMRKLLGRVPLGIPKHKIIAFTRFGLELARRRRQAHTPSDRTRVDLWAGRTFCRLVEREGFGTSEGLYTFNTASLELLEAANKCGIRTVMEQTIAPRELETQLLAEEYERFPDWEDPILPDTNAKELEERRHAEWRLAGTILCGSAFVKEAVVTYGGMAERCIVVPYGVEEITSPPERSLRKGPLRVLTVGTVCLRKGMPYLLEAAKRLKGNVTFRLVGAVAVEDSVVNKMQDYIEIVGSVPRSEVLAHYAWADVFLLPSLCEGSATVTYEALAMGLPVICTPNSGSVVRDTIDGFIVEIRNSEMIIQKIELLSNNRSLALDLGRNASQRSKEFNLIAYRERLLKAISGNDPPEYLELPKR